MKIKISENIRAFRKERKFTQEQLAEALGVSVGAVSKWESGASIPDISLIMELADFFETSVDVLLGYEWQSHGMGQAAQRIDVLTREKRFEEAIAEAGKALQKYPNSFSVVHNSAELFSFCGMAQSDAKMLRRSLELYHRALELFSQNQDPEISVTTIQQQAALVYVGLDQPDKALELLKENNFCGIYSGQIGCILASNCHKPDEALPYLTDALGRNVLDLFSVVTGYMNAYADKKDFSSALDILDWYRSLTAGLNPPGVITYLSKMAVILSTVRAVLLAKSGDRDAAREALRQAKSQALLFDAAPSDALSGIKFYHKEKAAIGFDNFGSTAMEGISNQIGKDGENRRLLGDIWEEVKHESG